MLKTFLKKIFEFDNDSYSDKANLDDKFFDMDKDYEKEAIEALQFMQNISIGL